MDILELIKRRRTIRKYKNKPIPQRLLDKIIEAGIWGPSVRNLQIWRFAVIKNRALKSKISNIIMSRSKKTYAIYRFLMKRTAYTISSSQILILVYNTGKIRDKMERYGKIYYKCGTISEVESISAAIQNMLLVAESLNIASSWMTLPLLCEKEINKLSNSKESLVAALAFGYPAEKGVRAIRKPFSDNVKFIN